MLNLAMDTAKFQAMDNDAQDYNYEALSKDHSHYTIVTTQRTSLLIIIPYESY